jgi:hypothetical protein
VTVHVSFKPGPKPLLNAVHLHCADRQEDVPVAFAAFILVPRQVIEENKDDGADGPEEYVKKKHGKRRRS